ncbi:hypothetical protein BUMB_05805c [Candidatus Paraburkholderia calva]|nr:hypothetical protein BUMB_05805c [Candidatus Paraburkholderia calva]
MRLPITVFDTAINLSDVAEVKSAFSGRPLRVLVVDVDDRSDGADALAELLWLDGHDTEAAYGGKASRRWKARIVADQIWFFSIWPCLEWTDSRSRDVCAAICRCSRQCG